MNEKQKPSLHDLSLYYDGLLDDKDVEERIENGEDERRMLNVFECFDHALDDELSDERIDALLDDNLKCIHERLVMDERSNRRESVSLWDWLLMPRNLIAGLAAILVLFGVFSTMGPMNSTQTNVADAFPTPFGKSDANVVAIAPEDDAPVVDETQKQVILAAADLAKMAFSSSVDYAKEQTKPLGESLKAISQTSALSAAYKALTSSGNDAETQSGGKQAVQTLSPNEQLARTGTKQLAIGLGASLLSLMSII